MKKILSVMLAVLMLFGALSIGASAATQLPYDKDQIFGQKVEGVTVSKNTHAILTFDFAGGSSKFALPVFDTTVNGFVSVDKFSGKYIMLPGSEVSYLMTAGNVVQAPYVTAPEGYDFNGWWCPKNGEYYTQGEDIKIENTWVGSMIELKATYIPAEAEEDTMKMVLGVLTKVFGTILGLLFLDGSSAAGIELVEKLLGGLM